MSMGKKRLEQLLASKEQLEAKIKQEQAKLKSEERRKETRRKVLIGAMIQEWVKQGKWSEQQLTDCLDTFLTRDYDRVLFGLREKPTKTKKQQSSSGKAATKAGGRALKSAKASTKAKPGSTEKSGDAPLQEVEDDALKEEFNL